MPNRSSNDVLVPQASQALERLKSEVAREVGWQAADPTQLQQQFDVAKFQIANQLHIPLQHGYNGDLPSNQAGAIGGRIGGRIGGQMVRRMIALAETQLSGGQTIH